MLLPLVSSRSLSSHVFNSCTVRIAIRDNKVLDTQPVPDNRRTRIVASAGTLKAQTKIKNQIFKKKEQKRGTKFCDTRWI